MHCAAGVVDLLRGLPHGRAGRYWRAPCRLCAVRPVGDHADGQPLTETVGGNGLERRQGARPAPRLLVRLGVQLLGQTQQPVAAHRRMPVEAAVKRGGQLPRRTDIPIRGHHVAHLVRVLLMHTGQREIGEALHRLGIEVRWCGVATTPRGRRDRTDRADSISSPPTWARW